MEATDRTLASMSDLPSHQETGGPGIPGQGASPSGPTTSIPWITYTIIVICGAICAFLNLGKGSSSYVDIGNFLMPTGPAIWLGAYWGMFTTAFTHIAVWHILFNMWWLKDFGNLLEPTMGRIKFILFILAAAAVSSGAQLALTDDTGIGFSGVVYAMFGYMLAARNVEPVYQKIVDKQTIVWLMGWLVLCIVLTVAGIWSVANGSHIAGFLFGLCIGYTFTARSYILVSRLGLVLLIALTVLSATYMPWSEAWLAESGDYEAAIRGLSKVIQKNPDNADAYFNRGLSFFRAKNYQEAIKDLDKCIYLEPKATNAYGLRGAANINLSNFHDSIKDFDKVIELSPKEARAYLSRGYSYSKLGNHQQAIKDYDKAIELDPEAARAYAERGLSHLALNNNQEAIRDYSKAIDMSPQYKKVAYIYNNRGTAYSQQGDTQRAMQDYDKAIEIDPKYMLAYNNRGQEYQKQKKYPESLAEFDKAIEVEPDDSDSYYDKACTYSLMNKPAEACSWLQKSIEKGFNDWSHIKSDPDLNNIRNSSCYKEIMSGS